MQFGPPEEKVLFRHGVLNLGRVGKFRQGDAGSNLLRKSGVARHPVKERLDLIAIKEGPTMADVVGNACGTVPGEG